MGAYNLKSMELFSVMFVFHNISSSFDFATGYELRNCLINSTHNEASAHFSMPVRL